MNNLDFYRQFSEYTDAGLYKVVLEKALPNDVREVGLLVRKSLIHRMTWKNGNTGSNKDLRYGDMTKIPWYRQCEDNILVTAAAMLNELFRRDKRGLVLDRKSENKLIVTCRNTSILTASLLKIKNIPARVRSGFAPYFIRGQSVDHWINQYWSEPEKRWATIDVDGSLEDYIKFDRYDICEGKFDFSADAWLKVRRGEIEAEHFHNAGGFEGLVTIAWELFYDFHCLMNSEVPYYPHPEIAMLDNFKKASEQKLKEIDELAEIMVKPDENFEKLQRIWETKKEFRLLFGWS